MVTAAIDIHKQVVQAAVLDSERGAFVEDRLAGREALVEWAVRWRGRLSAVAIEATSGWRWVARELQAYGFEVRIRNDPRCRALEGIFAVGPILACRLLAEIGDAHRFRRARQITRLAGLDPVVQESADSRRRGTLAKQGPPTLRWALVQAAQHAPRTTSPDRALYASASHRCGSQRAN